MTIAVSFFYFRDKFVQRPQKTTTAYIYSCFKIEEIRF